MAYSKIVLDFNRRVEIGEYLTFSWRDLDVNGGATTYLTNEEWANIRFRPGLVEYTLAGNNGEVDAQLYVQSFNYDFNGGNLFTVQITGGKQVTITAKKDNIEFINPGSTGGVGIVITNEAQVPTFVIDSITYEEPSADKCSQVKVRVACSSTPTALLNPVVPYTIEGDDIVFDYPRNINIQASVTNGTTTQNQSFTTPAP